MILSDVTLLYDSTWDEKIYPACYAEYGYHTWEDAWMRGGIRLQISLLVGMKYLCHTILMSGLCSGRSAYRHIAYLLVEVHTPRHSVIKSCEHIMQSTNWGNWIPLLHGV